MPSARCPPRESNPNSTRFSYLLSTRQAEAPGVETADELSRDSLVCGWAGPGVYSMSTGRNQANLLVERDGAFAVKMTNGYNERSVTGVGRVVGVEARCVRRGASIELQDAGEMFFDLTFELLGDFEGSLGRAAGVEAPEPGASALKEWCHSTSQDEMLAVPEEEDEEALVEEEKNLGHWEASEAHFFTQMYSFAVPEYLCPKLGTEQEERADRLIECKEPVQAWVLETAAAFADEVKEMRDYELESWEDGWVAQMTTKLQDARTKAALPGKAGPRAY